MKAHEAIPDPGADWAACRLCGEPVMEAIYTGGWMHAERLPHPFAAFVYADGSLSDKVCTRCAQPMGAAIHRDPTSVHRVTPLLDPIPAGGVAFLPDHCEAAGGNPWRVDVTTVDGTVLMAVEAPGASVTLSAHLTPEATRRLAHDLMAAAGWAAEEAKR